MSHKSVNLYYLYTASKVGITSYRIYDKVLSKRDKVVNIGDREKGSLYSLVYLLLKEEINIDKLNNFYYSYTIPHIGKEFDILKISNDKVLNIELKSQNVGLERIKEQLLCNYKYLKYLSKEMYLFTFVSDEKVFYKLDDGFNLKVVNLKEVIQVINSFSNDYLEIDKLFKTSDYLVSPNGDPYKFIQGQYFLTTQQEFIKNKILSTINVNNYYKITGDAGVGKTLLLFDIAKELSENDNVLIINCNKYNSNHKVITENLQNLHILTLSELEKTGYELRMYKYILIDEAQRLEREVFNLLKNINGKKIIVPTKLNIK